VTPVNVLRLGQARVEGGEALGDGVVGRGAEGTGRDSGKGVFADGEVGGGAASGGEINTALREGRVNLPGKIFPA
jgi:hypothetical protein